MSRRRPHPDSHLLLALLLLAAPGCDSEPAVSTELASPASQPADASAPSPDPEPAAAAAALVRKVLTDAEASLCRKLCDRTLELGCGQTQPVCLQTCGEMLAAPMCQDDANEFTIAGKFQAHVRGATGNSAIIQRLLAESGL